MALLPSYLQERDDLGDIPTVALLHTLLKKSP